jgi:hypothetical protein
MSEKIKFDGVRIDVEALLADIERNGFALVAITDNGNQHRDSALQIAGRHLTAIAKPIQIFGQYPEWRPICVKIERPLTRSEGVGQSPLHMDFVNAANPPDLVVLYCERPDPAGGGDTTLAPVSAAELLTPEIRALLAEPFYSDGKVIDLKNIGEDINPFAILASDSTWQFRYTGQLLASPLADNLRNAVQALDAALRAEMITVSLGAGDAVIIDQRKMVHGRLPLGLGQEAIEEDRRRLLWQRFGRKY